jgi:hypothetical protein
MANDYLQIVNWQSAIGNWKLACLTIAAKDTIPSNDCVSPVSLHCFSHNSHWRLLVVVESTREGRHGALRTR